MLSDFARTVVDHGIVAILRGVVAEEIPARVRGLQQAGVRMVEVALSDPEAVSLVRVLRREAASDTWVGAGTVTTVALAEAAVREGAGFLVTPHVVPEVIAFGRERGVGVLSGAFTPTEIASVYAAGGELVKLFPASAVGPSYLRMLLAPYPQAKIVAVGGIDRSNADAYLAAGAVGLGVGGSIAALPPAGGDGTNVEAAKLVETFRRHRGMPDG